MGFVNSIQGALAAAADVAMSLIKIVVLSRRTGSYRGLAPSSRELVVLGNGPSLRRLLDGHRGFLDGKDLMVVNFSSTSADYEELRPSYYLLMDPAFFDDEATCRKAFEPMVGRTTWDMVLFAPVSARRQKLWQELVGRNKRIRVLFFNPTPIEGPAWFCHLCYNLRLGMPRPRNVLVACCMTALQLPYAVTYLAGADHSWMKEIWVDEHNVVQEDRAHFYDKGKTTRVTSPHKLHELVGSMAVAFKSYHFVEAYSRTLGKRILNITDGSYIDAFERLNLD